MYLHPPHPPQPRSPLDYFTVELLSVSIQVSLLWFDCIWRKSQKVLLSYLSEIDLGSCELFFSMQQTETWLTFTRSVPAPLCLKSVLQWCGSRLRRWHNQDQTPTDGKRQQDESQRPQKLNLDTIRFDIKRYSDTFREKLYPEIVLWYKRHLQLKILLFKLHVNCLYDLIYEEQNEFLWTSEPTDYNPLSE